MPRPFPSLPPAQGLVTENREKHFTAASWASSLPWGRNLSKACTSDNTVEETPPPHKQTQTPAHGGRLHCCQPGSMTSSAHRRPKTLHYREAAKTHARPGRPARPGRAEPGSCPPAPHSADPLLNGEGASKAVSPLGPTNRQTHARTHSPFHRPCGLNIVHAFLKYPSPHGRFYELLKAGPCPRWGTSYSGCVSGVGRASQQGPVCTPAGSAAFTATADNSWRPAPPAPGRGG